MKLNVRVIANNSPWASWPQKIQAIKDFYAPNVDLNITLEHTSLSPKFSQYGTTMPGQLPVYVVDEAWYEANTLRSGQDIGLFIVPPIDHPNLITLFGVECGNPKGEWETTIFGNETDSAYVEGVNEGNSITWFMIHELSHVFYAMLGKADKTHTFFNQKDATNPTVSWNPKGILQDLNFSSMDPVKTLEWDTQQQAYHSVRVLCDNAGLSIMRSINVDGRMFMPKDIICACIYEESRFKTQAKGPTNKNGTHDWGICQYNDGHNAHGIPLWIGPGAYFKDVAEVLANPEKGVNEMISMYKVGHIDWWMSHSTGAYKQWLLPDSPIWLLKIPT